MEDAPQGSVPKVGDRLQIWWPHDRAFYPGYVHSYNQEDGTHFIKYDDGETEYLDMKNERWRRLNDDSQPKDEPSIQDNPPTAGNTATKTVTSNSPSKSKSKNEPKPSPPPPSVQVPTQKPESQAQAQAQAQTRAQAHAQVPGPSANASAHDPATGATTPTPAVSKSSSTTQPPIANLHAPAHLQPSASTQVQVRIQTQPAKSSAPTPVSAPSPPPGVASGARVPSPHLTKFKRTSNGKFSPAASDYKVSSASVGLESAQRPAPVVALASGLAPAPKPTPAVVVATSKAPQVRSSTGIRNASNKRSAPSSGASSGAPNPASTTVTAPASATSTGATPRSNLMNVPKKKMRTELHSTAPSPQASRIQVVGRVPAAEPPAANITNSSTILPPAPRPNTSEPLVVKHKLTAPAPLPARNVPIPAPASASTPMQGVTVVRRVAQQQPPAQPQRQPQTQAQAQPQPQPQSQQQPLARRNSTPLERVFQQHINEVVKVQRGVTTLHSMYRDLMKQMRVEDGDGVRRSNLLQAEVESMRSDLRRLMDGQHELHAQIGQLHERLDSITPRTGAGTGTGGGGYVQRSTHNNQGYRVNYGGHGAQQGGSGGVVVGNNYRYGTEFDQRGYDERQTQGNQATQGGRPQAVRRISADIIPQSESIVAKAKSDALNLAARQVMIWLLETDHECRVNDIASWAQIETTKCMERVAFLLGKFQEYDHALRVLTDSLGVEAANLLWFTDTPSADNLRLARKNYDVWDPPPTDGEWVAEIKLLVEVERRFKNALHNVEVNINDSHLRVTINVATAAINPIPHHVVVRGRPNGNHQAVVTRAPPDPPRIPNRNPVVTQAPFRQSAPQPIVRAPAPPPQVQQPQRVVQQAPPLPVQQHPPQPQPTATVQQIRTSSGTNPPHPQSHPQAPPPAPAPIPSSQAAPASVTASGASAKAGM